MNARSLACLALVAVLAVAGSGCLTKETTKNYRAFGSTGKYANGWDYDGKTTEALSGNVYVDVDEMANKGRIVARGSIAGVPVEILFETFAEQGGKSFQNGGLAHDFVEHGSSGVGDTSIPRVDLEMAGWGRATYKSNGTVYADPITGMPTWAAHFMVIRNGVRDNATGAIYADSAKKAFYSPANASAGYSEPGDYELHIVLKNNTANASAPVAFNVVEDAAAPSTTYTAEKPLFTASAPSGSASFWVNLTGTATAGKDYTFTVKGPDGQAVPTTPATIQVRDGPATRSVFVTFAAAKSGEYKIAATGTHVPPGGWSAKGTWSPPKMKVLYFWWEDLVFGSAASKEATQKGFAASPSPAPTTSLPANNTDHSGGHGLTVR